MKKVFLMGLLAMSLPYRCAALALRHTEGNTLADMKTEASYTFTLLADETNNFHIVAPTAASTVAFAEQHELKGVEITV